MAIMIAAAFMRLRLLIQGDNIRLYYGGSNGLHNGWREGSFNWANPPQAG